jgi:phosphoribosylamine-glycine ligase
MIGTALPYNRLAEPVKVVNEKISGALKKYNYRGFLSTEIRYTKDKKPFFIDPCCRLGTPSNELLQELFEGWANVLWEGAVGNMVTPKVKAKFAVMAVIHSEWAVNDWQALHYPKALDEHVKLRFHTRIGGEDYVSPQPVGMPDLGGVVGTGNTLLEAVAQCKERAGQIKGYQLKVSLESISEALESIKKGEELGIHFADQLPTEAQVKKA